MTVVPNVLSSKMGAGPEMTRVEMTCSPILARQKQAIGFLRGMKEHLNVFQATKTVFLTQRDEPSYYWKRED